MDEILVGSLNEEIRNGFLVSEKRKAVWNVELCLLKRLDEVCKKYNLKRKDVVNILRDNDFIIKQGYKYNTIIALKFGIKEYIDNINNKPSLTKLAKKYKVNRNVFS